MAWCRCASGPAAKPPARMLCIRGKPGNHPRGKIYFPPRMFPGFLGPEALKLSVTPARQAEVVDTPYYVISPVVGPGSSGPWRRSGGAQPPAFPLLALTFTLEKTIKSDSVNPRFRWPAWPGWFCRSGCPGPSPACPRRAGSRPGRSRRRNACP